MSLPLEDQIPLWFWAVLATGLFAFVSLLGGLAFMLIKYVIRKNQNELNEMKESITKMSISISELVGIVKLHEYRITDQEKDIKELYRDTRGRIVNYPKE